MGGVRNYSLCKKRGSISLNWWHFYRFYETGRNVKWMWHDTRRVVNKKLITARVTCTVHPIVSRMAPLKTAKRRSWASIEKNDSGTLGSRCFFSLFLFPYCIHSASGIRSLMRAPMYIYYIYLRNVYIDI